MSNNYVLHFMFLYVTLYILLFYHIFDILSYFFFNPIHDHALIIMFHCNFINGLLCIRCVTAPSYTKTCHFYFLVKRATIFANVLDQGGGRSVILFTLVYTNATIILAYFDRPPLFWSELSRKFQRTSFPESDQSFPKWIHNSI